uniref:Uncharacterized protein n=1 Tax=Myoviridae sp. ctGRa7 TaxID=2826633 RepID=A0A8S5N024_9CAUD|nr:MAG TPA: hypothetical protein [Myoviridae sp. ctGRa7]
MAAPDFFENFLLHDGVKALHPNENLSIVSLVSSETTRQADTLRIEVPAFYPWGRGGLTASPPVGALLRPRHCQAYSAGPRRSMPGNSAFHAEDLAGRTQFRRQLTTCALAFPGELAVVYRPSATQLRIPPKKHVDETARPVPHPGHMPAPAAGGQRFVRPDHRQVGIGDAGQHQGRQQPAQAVHQLIDTDHGLPAIVPDDLAPRHAWTSGKWYRGTMSSTSSTVWIKASWSS